MKTTMKTRKTRHKKLINKYFAFNTILFLFFVFGFVYLAAKILG